MKPKKRKTNTLYKTEQVSNSTSLKNIGYNQCHDEYEKFLPSEKELIEMMESVDSLCLINDRAKKVNDYETLAGLISKRLRGEK